MFSALISFFGSAAFRWLAGEAVDFFKARDDHKRELAMMALTWEQERQRHDWQQAAIKAQADAGVKVIEAKREASAGDLADRAFLAAVEGTSKPSGVAWIDGFNALIRPELAQVSILLIAGNAIWPTRVVLSGVVLEVVCGVLGLYIGGRIKSTGR